MNFENIEKLVDYVNINLKAGGSVAKIERDLGFGKDTIRKKLNRANYIYSKELKEFTKSNTGITRKNKEIVLENNTNITLEKQDIVLRGNTKEKRNVLQDNTNITLGFSDEDIDILKSIIKNYKKLAIEKVEFKGEVITRSFRTYEEVLNKFVKYCNDNKFVQKEAIAQAMMDFINK